MSEDKLKITVELNGKEISISDISKETWAKIHGEAATLKPFDETVYGIRVSSSSPTPSKDEMYPLRISTRDDNGRARFGSDVRIAGDSFPLDRAIDLIDCLQRAVKHHGG